MAIIRREDFHDHQWRLIRYRPIWRSYERRDVWNPVKILREPRAHARTGIQAIRRSQRFEKRRQQRLDPSMEVSWHRSLNKFAANEFGVILERHVQVLLGRDLRF